MLFLNEAATQVLQVILERDPTCMVGDSVREPFISIAKQNMFASDCDTEFQWTLKCVENALKKIMPSHTEQRRVFNQPSNREGKPIDISLSVERDQDRGKQTEYQGNNKGRAGDIVDYK